MKKSKSSNRIKCKKCGKNFEVQPFKWAEKTKEINAETRIKCPYCGNDRFNSSLGQPTST